MDHTGEIATDHYHRYKQDVALMKELGVKAYRFGASWPRVIVDASGKVNSKGIDFYQRLIDELLSAGIQPWMTLFHWDLPQWAEDKFRGWESKDCAKAFADYAGVMVTFEPGARTAWHTHPLGQTLIVTSGCGWAQRQGGPEVTEQSLQMPMNAFRHDPAVKELMTPA